MTPEAEPAPARTGLEHLLERFPPQVYERGEILIENTLLETADLVPSAAMRPGGVGPRGASRVGFVVEGLVRGMWNRSRIAPQSHATAVVAGDGRWVGADAFKYGQNIFRYTALTPSTVSLLPLAWMLEEAPRAVLLDALRSVSLDWCTAASVLSLGADTLGRRTLLLLFDLSRLHPRPELEVRQVDVANMLGVTRQTLQPILKDIERRGLIALGYGEIVIEDPIALVKRLRRREGPPGPGPEAQAGPGSPARRR